MALRWSSKMVEAVSEARERGRAEVRGEKGVEKSGIKSSCSPQVRTPLRLACAARVEGIDSATASSTR